MNVKELIKKLLNYDMDTEVLISVQNHHSFVDLEDVELHNADPGNNHQYVVLTHEEFEEESGFNALASGIFKEAMDKAKEKIKVTYFPDGRMDSNNASSYVGLSKKSMAQMRCDGTGPKFIKRGRIFYYKEDLDSWINNGGRNITTEQCRYKMSKESK